MPSITSLFNRFLEFQKKLLDLRIKILKVMCAPFVVALAVHVSSLIEPPEKDPSRTIFQIIAIVIYLALPTLLIEGLIRRIIGKKGDFIKPFKREALFLVVLAATLFIIKNFDTAISYNFLLYGFDGSYMLVGLVVVVTIRLVLQILFSSYKSWFCKDM